LVKIGTTGAQKKLCFKLRRLKGQLRAIDDGDLRPDQVALIADTLSVSKQDVISMNGLLSASDRSLNVPVYQDSEDQWQDWLADEADSQGIALAEHEELFTRKALLFDAFKVLRSASGKS
jgi:RNA polymerase sigma-32 factor